MRRSGHLEARRSARRDNASFRGRPPRILARHVLRDLARKRRISLLDEGLHALAHVGMAAALDRHRLVDGEQIEELIIAFAEGVPVVLMEAMAAGVPVVATRIAGIPELVLGGESGFLVPPADAESLAARVADLLDDSNLRNRFAAAGRAKVEPAGRELSLPRNGQTEDISFAVTPLAAGKIRLRFRVYLAAQGNLLQELRVDVRVVRQPRMAIA